MSGSWMWGWPAVEAIATAVGVALAGVAAWYAYHLNAEQLKLAKDQGDEIRQLQGRAVELAEEENARVREARLKFDDLVAQPAIGSESVEWAPRVQYLSGPPTLVRVEVVTADERVLNTSQKYDVSAQSQLRSIQIGIDRATYNAEMAAGGLKLRARWEGSHQIEEISST